ncbi:DegT/DnrJ/EryC1/StrS family aminotransferase [Saccharothrix syringae]|uniref:DegT/DnrJ/EryC1/StrS family aminotransferase n=1 Tax=Saccharothrix syringae TaxID=103733 RepID=A0A5Q0HF95_SACSY|nr:DegT/DnrJ/EryC1/StrS family aminotransferase [Saccharothrix syringae]
MSRNARPHLHGTELDALHAVLADGVFGHGPRTERFERELARFLGVADVVAVATGTAALHLALLAAGVGPGDEVVVPSQTFCATVQAVLATGAHPRFAEIDPDTLCVTAATVRAALGPRTRAVVPVLYGGRAVDLADLHELFDRRGITVVEDAAHAFGSHHGDRRVGGTGLLTCFSFDPVKNLTCGEGGAVVPRTPEDARRVRRLRGLAIDADHRDRARSTGYTVTGFGMRAHLPALNAALGLAQLAGFDLVADRRDRLWRAYRDRLGELALPDRVRLVDLDIDHTVPFHCVVRVPDRDRVFHCLQARGIGVGVHYPPNHLQPAFADWHTPLPVTEATGVEILSLPLHPALTVDDVDTVVTALHDVLRTTSGALP